MTNLPEELLLAGFIFFGLCSIAIIVYFVKQFANSQAEHENINRHTGYDDKEANSSFYTTSYKEPAYKKSLESLYSSINKYSPEKRTEEFNEEYNYDTPQPDEEWLLRLDKSIKKTNNGISPKKLIELREQRKGFTGIYIIYNETKDMYYVGQGQNVYVRCSNHFLGKGNADIYADYKYGDTFHIEFISLVESGYDNLDDLERFYINKYDAVRKGYNKTKGNR